MHACSVMADSLRSHGLQPTRFLCPWGFSRREYWSGLPFLTPEIKPISLTSSALTGRFFTTSTAIQFSAFQFSHSVVSDSLRPHGLQNARLTCPSPTPGAYSNSCPSSRWCHPVISSSVILFSSCLQSFLASGSFPRSWLFASSGQSTDVSASASCLPMNIQDWFPLGWTGCISLQSRVLSEVFSSTIVQKHQFFSAQLSL